MLSSSNSNRSLVVIGGGAAGFFCAVNAARLNPELKVILLEKTGKLLSKVRVSGGGRCNVTHQLTDRTEMSRRYPRGEHFVKKTFHQFFTTDTIEWFARRDVELKTETDGRMFPVSNKSETIIRCLLNEAARYNVDIRMNADVKQLVREDAQWKIVLGRGEMLTATSVCVACGGFPKPEMFDWITALGHTIETPLPSLFTFNLPGHPISKLMGVSVEHARVKIEGMKLVEEGPLLITHWGLSGPSVLKLSAWGARDLASRNYHFNIHVNWIPAHTLQELKEVFQDLRRISPAKKILNHHFEALPSRLFEYLLTSAGITSGMRFADLPAKLENALVTLLTDSVFEVKGKTTFKEEFVTAGGILLSEVDAQTMESRKHRGLYFAGEILNVDGITGGFNFQHAWTSGWIAANAIAHQG